MLQQIAVLVEDVVHDLEEQADLVREGSPRSLLAFGHVRHPERARNGCGEQAARLEPVQRGQVGLGSGDVEVLASDHPERRLDELARDRGRRVGKGEPQRLCQQRVAGEDRDRLAETGPGTRPPSPQLVVVERRQVVVDEREVVHELESSSGGQRGFGLRARRLRGREAEHGTNALAAARERVAHRLLETVELRSQREIGEV